MSNSIPETGFLRLPQILGNKKTVPPTPPLIPIGKTAWWAGVKSGLYPKPVKIGSRATAWRAADIIKLIETLGAEA